MKDLRTIQLTYIDYVLEAWDNSVINDRARWRISNCNRIIIKYRR
jgi:hypothetical protein